MSIISVLKGFIEDLIGEKESNGWEYIGEQFMVTGERKGNIPHWVVSALERIYQKHGGSSSSFLDKYFILKGHHFEYKLTYEGQGGMNCYVERRRRQGR